MTRTIFATFVAFATLALTTPAAALDSLDEVACICADGALNTGDHVSCVAKFSRRLQAAGVITRAERSSAVSSASDADLDLLGKECPPAFGDGGGGDVDLTGWGASVSVSTPKPEVSPAFLTAVDVRARIWNLTACTICPDVFMELPVQPNGDICLYEARLIRDGLVERSEFLECDLTDTTFAIPRGTLVERDLILPLLSLDSESGLPDGTILDGVLELEVRWAGDGPQFAATDPSTGGRRALARVPIRTN